MLVRCCSTANRPVISDARGLIFEEAIMSLIDRKLSRRDFLGTSLGAAALAAGVSKSAMGANERVNVGVVGSGSQGGTLIRNLATVANARIVGMCDIFEPNLKKGVNLAGS